jgi:hypothetical protein
LQKFGTQSLQRFLRTASDNNRRNHVFSPKIWAFLLPVHPLFYINKPGEANVCSKIRKINQISEFPFIQNPSTTVQLYAMATLRQRATILQLSIDGANCYIGHNALFALSEVQ